MASAKVAFENVRKRMVGGYWVLPEDYCKKDLCNFNTEMFVSKVGNPCPTLGQLLGNRILYALLVREKHHEIARARFCTQSWKRVLVLSYSFYLKIAEQSQGT